jgi:hypothetical protein
MKKVKETLFVVGIILVTILSAINLPEVGATKPKVQTLTPTNITSTSVTIRGTINPASPL